MKRLLAATALCLACAAPALADGKVYVQLPDLPTFPIRDAEALLHGLVTAVVVSSNCAGYEVSEAEWSLLSDSADMIAYAQLGLNIEDYDAIYWQPAFAFLEEDGTCAAEGPGVDTMLDNLVRLGGSRQPLPDQDAAHEAYQLLQAQWEARQGQLPLTEMPAGKTKKK